MEIAKLSFITSIIYRYFLCFWSIFYVVCTHNGHYRNAARRHHNLNERKVNRAKKEKEKES